MRPLEQRVADLHGIIDDVRFAHLRAVIDTLEARVAAVEVKLDTMRSEIKALPSILVAMLDERAKRGSG
jgi:uncharacterized coiled-coil protein SlyX